LTNVIQIPLKFFLGDEHSAAFLIKHSCLLNHQTNTEHITPLHLLSSLNSTELSSDIMADMCRVAHLILEYGADANEKDVQGNNCLHRAIIANNMPVFHELLKASSLRLDDRNIDDDVPLWLALQQAEQMRKLTGL
jgi:ankyrin repeat protein